MKLLIASNNKGKLREIKEILGGFYEQIVTPAELGLTLDVEETGQTFLDNARLKAHAFAKAAHMDALADDSGLCVDALDGAPGVYSARYAGNHGDDAANNALLLKNMEHVADGQRGARFVCCVVLASPDGTELCAEGDSAGEILRAPQGTGGFGYDPLFYVPRFQRTYAELTAEEKNGISHRAQALSKLKRKWETLHG